MSPRSDLLVDVRQAPTIPLPRPPELVRSQTAPWSTTPLPVAPPGAQQSPIQTLRKRHSTYIRPMERSTSPIPELPPHRPPRNPARASTNAPDGHSPPPPPKVKTRSRPTTATGSMSTNRDEVTPWESQPGPETSRMRSAAPSVRSKASSIGLSTGPIEEVTPWDLFPAPPNLPSPKPSSSNSNLVLSPTPPVLSPRTLHPTKATGLTEDVAPWELSPGPPPSAPSVMDNQAQFTSMPRPLSLKARSQPASLLSEPNSATYRISTATGPTEEVTPWELQPPLTEEPEPHARQRNSLTMSKAQLEEVMPWELYPPPPPPISAGTSSIKNSKTGVQSARNSTSKALGDFTLIRRRRSTGSRASKSRSNSQAAHPALKPQPHGLNLNGLANGQVDEATTPKTAKSSAISSTDAWQNGLPSGQSTPNGDYHAPPSSAKHPTGTPRFSTADRTILEELKRNIHARNAQFVMKGVGIHLTDGTISPGKKHHPFVSKDVPYPRSYEREVIDLDVWETLFCQDICESLTFHVFEEPPLRVLDIGCGTGTWILNCARQWRETHFDGLDIVPLHPDLQQVGSADLASRITWTQANFLDGLPFPNDEFDFVHIKRIALGVPEDKWDGLFDEISRVMKPGGAFEMVEEDLFFPGKPVQQDDDDIDHDRGSILSRSSSMTSGGGRREVPASIQEDGGEEEMQLPTETFSSLATPSTVTAFPKTPNNPNRPELRVTTGEGIEEDLRSQASTTPPGSPKGYITLIPPHSRSSARPLLYVKASNNSSGHSVFASTSPPKPSSSSFSNSAVSLLNSLTHSQSDSDHSHGLFRRRRSSSNLTHTSANGPSQSQSQNNHTSSIIDTHHDSPPLPTPPKPDGPKIPPFLLRTPAKAPANPRDHSFLEYIYKEMLSSKFINVAPLSLLTSYLEYHFKDARTHPPLLYTFPPLPIKLEPASEEEKENISSPTNYDNSPVRSASSRRSFNPPGPVANENGELLEEHRWLSMQGLLKHASPFVSLDDTPTYAYTPTGRYNHHSMRKGGKDKAKHGRNGMETRIPNKTLNIDLRTLNLHLMTRVKEILGCSETMWEWVRDKQLAAQNEAATRRSGLPNGRGHSLDIQRAPGSSLGSHGSGPSDHRAALLNLSREDFNQMLVNFEMDMHDQASVHTALKERFQWNVIESDPPQNRKIFNTACEKYDKWLKQEQRPSPSPASLRPSRASLQIPSSNGHSSNGHSSSGDSPYTRNRSNSQTILLNRASSNGTASAMGGGSSVNGSGPMAHSLSTGSTQSYTRSDASVHFALPRSQADLAPYEKLSRAMRVFVAWKPEETPASAKS